jgi:hypothetical protein
MRKVFFTVIALFAALIAKVQNSSMTRSNYERVFGRSILDNQSYLILWQS